FNKGTLLYGLNLAKDEVIEKGSVIICEGHLDLIALFQAGIRNACASQGTAFTATHAKLLKRYAENVICAFDGDSAGEAATLRSCEIFIAEGLAVKIAVMPKGFDPDLLIREKGKEGFEQVVAAAHDLFDFKLTLLKKKSDASTLAGKTRIAAEMISTINQFPSAVARSESIRRLADALDVKEDALLQELKKGQEPRRQAANAGAGGEQQQPMPPWERDFISLALEDHRFIGAIGAICELRDFQDERARRILGSMMALRDENRLNHASLVNGLDDPALRDAVSSLAFRVPEGADRATLFRDYLFAIRQKSLTRDVSALAKQIAEAEQKRADLSPLLAEVEAKKTLLNNLKKEISLFSQTFKV
ncbi:MAG TPA: toprim domain-containing protein, partial [bacterium]|nr:toprim domain-containing protein [bacterium]